MNAPDGTQTNQPVAMIRPGLLDRLRTNSGIKSDEAFAKLIGVSRATLQRYRNGDEPSLRAVINIAEAFGLALGEVVLIEPAETAHQTRELATA